jgi:hypothetical protein
VATPNLSAELLQAAVDAVAVHGNKVKAATALGIPRGTFDHRHREAVRRGYVPGKANEFEFTPLPESDVPIDELIAHRKRQFERKREHEEASRLIPIRVKIDGPIGILHFGDPHVDDDGTDIGALEHHTKLVRETEGLFGANAGDTTNNWCGRLARLYSEQSTSSAQAWRLAEWFIGSCRWLYMIGGNHDLWSGSGDPLKWIAKQQNALYQSSEARIDLQFPNKRSVRINARHDHSGSSIWNPAHGPQKALQLGFRDHIAIAGHKHESAYGVVKDPDSGITMHAIKVASYKIFDRYQKERGFRDMTLSPCVLTLIDPALPPTHPDLVKVFWDADEGVEFLKWKRRKAA